MLRGGQVGLERQVAQTNDGVHRGSDLVADVSQELALGPIGRIRSILGPGQFLFPLLALGDVKAMSDVPDEFALTAVARAAVIK